MGKLVFGGVLLLVAFFLMVARSGATGGRSSGMLRAVSLVFATLGAALHPGGAGGRHRAGRGGSEARLRHGGHAAAAAGNPPGGPLVLGGALLHPGGAVPAGGRRSGDHRGALQRADGDDRGRGAPVADQSDGGAAHLHRDRHRGSDPLDRPNAIRKGVRDGMVRFSINDISKRTEIATFMQSLVDSALITQPRAGGRAVPHRGGHRLLPARPAAPGAGGRRRSTARSRRSSRSRPSATGSRWPGCRASSSGCSTRPSPPRRSPSSTWRCCTT